MLFLFLEKLCILQGFFLKPLEKLLLSGGVTKSGPVTFPFSFSCSKLKNPTLT